MNLPWFYLPDLNRSLVKLSFSLKKLHILSWQLVLTYVSSHPFVVDPWTLIWKLNWVHALSFQFCGNYFLLYKWSTPRTAIKKSQLTNHKLAFELQIIEPKPLHQASQFTVLLFQISIINFVLDRMFVVCDEESTNKCLSILALLFHIKIGIPSTRA